MRTQTPFHPILYTDVFEVVALFGGEVEEGLGDGCSDGVVAFVLFSNPAVAIAVEAGTPRLCGSREEAERTAGDYRNALLATCRINIMSLRHTIPIVNRLFRFGL